MEISYSGLLPHQPAAALALLRALQRNGAALDASDMGVGKTYTAGAVLRALDVPTLVVGPKVSSHGWQAMGKHMGVEFDYMNYEALRFGNTPFGRWEYPMPKVRKQRLVCVDCKQEVNAAPCPYHPGGFHSVGKPQNLPHNFGKFHWHENIRCLVFDEAHRCAALDSLQADMLIAARRQRIPTLALSGTIATSPLHFRALGFLLGLHNLVDSRDGSGPAGFYRWAYAHGCRKLPFRGLHFAVGADQRQAVLDGLHNELFPSRGVRLRTSDIPDFPKCQITAELYDIDASGRINELYKSMDEALSELNERQAGRAATALTAILNAQEEIELLMVPIFVELAQDGVANGKHVALFFNYRRTVEEVCKRLKTDCKVLGAQHPDERNRNVERFQSDESPYIVATSEAGGISINLQDLHGNFPRLGLVSLGYSAVTARQVFGRLPRAGAKSPSLYRCILAAGTVQEKVHKALAPKLNNLDLLNDGDLAAANLPLTDFARRAMGIE